MIAIPKRLREGRTEQQPVAPSAFAPYGKSLHQSAEDAIAAAKMRNIDARTGKLKRDDPRPFDIWRAACVEAFPQVPHPAWSIKDRGRIKTAMKNTVLDPGMTFNDLLTWIALNWTAVIGAKFSWMTMNEPPKVPDIGFVLAFLDRWVEAYAELRWDTWLSAKERTQLERLMGKGMDRDRALLEMGKLDTAMKLRKEMWESEQRAKSAAAAARIDRQQAAKDRELMERYGGNVPVHPRSRLAQEQRALEKKPLSSPSVEAPLQAPKVRFDD